MDFDSTDYENIPNIQSNSRVVGSGEYLEKYMIPDLSSVEHWSSGKVELVLRVATQKSGDALLFDYGKIKRKYLKKDRWRTVNTFISNWTLSSIGDYMKVHWTEKDGGDKGVIKIIITMPSSENVPFETKIEFSIDKRDDNLGLQIVQFTDKTSQLYSTGSIQWYMKSQ